MKNLLIRIDKAYRESLEFSLVSIDGIFEIKSLNIKIKEAYPCDLRGVMIEGMLIPNSYTIPLVPNYDTYELYPLTIENNSSWVLKGRDIETFSINFKIPKMTAVLIYLEVIAKNHISNNRVVIKTEDIFIEKNGEKANLLEKYAYDNNKLSEEFSICLYKVLISKNLYFLESISVTDQEIILSEIIKLLDINPNSIKNHNDLYTLFDFDYHPLIVDSLFKVVEKIHNLQVEDEDILVLKPSLWGIGIDLKSLYKKISSTISSLR